jgi:hypothetical protein
MSSVRDGGKGNSPRPFAVSLEEFAENFEAIFGKKTNKPQPHVEPIPFAGLINLEEDADGNQDKDN